MRYKSGGAYYSISYQRPSRPLTIPGIITQGDLLFLKMNYLRVSFGELDPKKSA